MTILTGCTKTVVKTVEVNDFCEGRYESLWLLKEDFEQLFLMIENNQYRPTIYKITDYWTLNEKEYQLCLEQKPSKKYTYNDFWFIND